VTIATAADDTGMVETCSSKGARIMAVFTGIGRLWVSTWFLMTLRTSSADTGMIESRRFPIHRVMASTAFLLSGNMVSRFFVAVAAITHDRAVIHRIGIPAEGGMAIVAVIGGFRVT